MNSILKYIPLVLFFTFICWIIFDADMNKDNAIMDIGHQFKYGDKVGHFFLFGILALLLNISLGFKQIQLYKISFLNGSLIVLAFAITEEFTQLAFKTRTFDFVDMLFDFIGIWTFSNVRHLIPLIKKHHESKLKIK